MSEDVTLGFPRMKKPTPRQQEELKQQFLEAQKRVVNRLAEDRLPWHMVRDFHEKMGQPVGKEPHFLDGERLEFRINLIEEEFDELIEAIEEGDLANTFKEMADMVYVIQGLAVEMGGNLDAVFDEVHRSNMTKIGKDGVVKYRDDGKVLKPDTYEEADIQGVLF